MPRLLVLAVVVLSAFCLAAEVATGAPAKSQGLTPKQDRDLRALITSRMKLAHIPGASFAIGQNSQVVWSKAFGFADVENKILARTDTRFRTASIGKAFTATAAMQMAERGELDLSAEVQRYCPQYPVKARSITVLQLITHTSGIRHYEGAAAASEAYITRNDDRSRRILKAVDPEGQLGKV